MSWLSWINPFFNEADRTKSAINAGMNEFRIGANSAKTGVTNAANAAASGVNGAAGDANDLLRFLYDNEMGSISPYQRAGTGAIDELSSSMGDLTKGFDPGAAGLDSKFSYGAKDFQADPGYAFALQQAQQGIERSAAARGGVLGGGTMKAMADYTTGAASQEYDNAYKRAQGTYQLNYGNAFNTFESNQANRFNRLSGVAGMGQQANNMALDAGNAFGGRVSGNLMSAAEYGGDKGYNAAMYGGNVDMDLASGLAAGYMGKANAWNGAINNTLRTAMQAFGGGQ